MLDPDGPKDDRPCGSAGFGPTAPLLHAHRAQHVVGEPAIELGDGPLGQQRLKYRQGECCSPLAGIWQVTSGANRPLGANPGQAGFAASRPAQVDVSRRGQIERRLVGGDQADLGWTPATAGWAALDQRTYL